MDKVSVAQFRAGGADVEVYAFHAGSIKTQTQFMLKDTRVGTPFVIPVTFYLIRHGADWIAFDTGVNPVATQAPAAYLGEVRAAHFSPDVKPEHGFAVQIKQRLGLEPGELKAVFLSHGHFDHAGGLGCLRNTGVPIYLRPTELDGIMGVVDAQRTAAYVLGDFLHFRELCFREVEGIFDIFGDHSVVAFPSPGHTEGHQSLYVGTERPLILAADALYTLESLEKMVTPASAADFSQMLNAYAFFRVMSLMGAEVVPSHDPEYWEKASLAPKPFRPMR